MAPDTQKTDIASLIDREAREMESAPKVPIPKSSVHRGNKRSKTLQVRLNPAELEELERLAATRGLPTSTVAREAILQLIKPTTQSANTYAELSSYLQSMNAAMHEHPASLNIGFTSGLAQIVAEAKSHVPPDREKVANYVSNLFVVQQLLANIVPPVGLGIPVGFIDALMTGARSEAADDGADDSSFP